MRNKPAILILTDWYHPAYKAGGPITSLFNLCHFLKDDFQFYILTSNQDLDGSVLQNIKANSWIEGDNGEQVYYSSDGLSKIILNNAIQYTKSSKIYLNSMFSFSFTIKPLWWLRSQKDIQIFLSPRGMLHQQAFSQKRTKKSLFLSVIKKLSSFKRTVLIASNEGELLEIEKHKLSNKTVILANVPKLYLLQERRETAPKRVITVVSRIAPEKNSSMAIECISKIKEEVTVNWIGDGIDEEYKNKFLAQIDQLPEHITFLFHGAQNAAFIERKLRESKVFFLPTLGENFGHAIYEALAIGTPAVIGLKTPFYKIEKYGAGFAVDPKDADKNVKALKTLLQLSSQNLKNAHKSAKILAKESFNDAEARKGYLQAWL